MEEEGEPLAFLFVTKHIADDPNTRGGKGSEHSRVPTLDSISLKFLESSLGERSASQAKFLHLKYLMRNERDV